ncbi:tetratricopeptide repeat protein [Comamonas sp. GB3 AK4-5]|uniref:tetratricopeptide repeat protein n=1 Tax=Comamonas sp. GB3 AK4-5 TaxID=3231487 RepID=UPI00351EAED1
MHSAPPERPQVAPLWLILLLAGLIGCALWVLFPRKNLEQRLQSSQANIDLSESYLRNLLRSDPDNVELQDLLQRVEKAKALRLAADATPASKADQAAWADWETSYAQFQKSSSQNSPESASARQNALQKQKLIKLQHLDESQLLYLGQAALALGDEALAQRSFDTLLQRPESQDERSHILEIAAQAALGNGRYDAASHWYQQAGAASASLEQRKKYLLSAVAVLQAGNQQAAALALAEQLLGPYTDDPTVLYQLIAIARAAGQPAVAQRYAKQLLQLSWQQPSADEARPMAAAGVDVFGLRRQAFFWDDQMPARAPDMRNTAASTSSSSGPQLPFDDKVYTLGYTVFLENRNLEDAWRVAKAAVQHAPDDLVWRQRLAEVSEWTQRPSEALAQWHTIAQRSNDAAAWQQVLRLAPGLLEDGPLADALHYQLRHHPQDPQLLQALIATYERLGQPQKGIAVLQSLQPQHAELGEALAGLYERVGDDEAALQQWEQLLQQTPHTTPERAMKAAVLALRMGRGDLGLAWLRASASALPSDPQAAAEFLRLQAEVADHQNDLPTAEAAYAALLNTDAATPEDYDAFLQLLHQQDQTREAAAVARMGWDKLHKPRHFEQALLLYAQHQDWNSVTPMVQGLRTGTPDDALAALRAQPLFYTLLGNYYQGMHQPTKARAAYTAGLQVFPGSQDMRQALLWLAIDTGDATALHQLLQAYEAEWRQDSSMHEALAAAYLNLSQPQIALDQYLQPHLAEYRQDFLWMMGYADALEQNQQADLAWRLRKQLLQEQGVQPLSGNAAARRTQLAQWLHSDAGASTRRIARTRLLMNQQAGDAGMAVLRELLRMDQMGSSPPALSDAATDVLLGWYLEAGEYQAVRARLWQQYAGSRSKQQPLWAEITLALADEDRAAAGRLLETAGEALPRYDRITAAMQAGDTRMAQSAAFEAQTAQGFDDPLHQQLTDSLLAFSDSLGVQHASRRLNELAERSTTATWHLAMTPRWSLDVNALRIERSTRDSSLLQQPSNERGIDFRLHWKNEDHTATLRAGQRESLDRYHPLELQWEQRLGSRLRLRAQLGHQLPTEETTPLRMAGMKDQLSLGLSYAPTRQDSISLDHVRNRYQLQTGGRVGDGHNTTLQYLHNLRSDSPSLQAGMFWSSYSYQEGQVGLLQGRDLNLLRYLPNPPASIPAGFLLPRSFQYYGITLSTNQRYADDYTRAIRPFASLSLTRHSRDGAGYGLTLGVAGSLWGQDHLVLGANFAKSSPQVAGTTRELQISYRRHF